jgi:hypothetical protein
MRSNAKTVAEYLASLPEERRADLSAVRKVILDNLPKGYEECMNYGMIGYVVPHSIYPAGYHCDPKQPMPYACLASQKNYIALYAMTVYGDKATETWLRSAWKAAGKKLDMGKSCIRFKNLEAAPLDVIGQLIARVPVDRYIARIETVVKNTSRKPAKKTK